MKLYLATQKILCLVTATGRPGFMSGYANEISCGIGNTVRLILEDKLAQGIHKGLTNNAAI